MSWSTCYSGSNNIHFNFPPIMEDGRNYSSYQPDAIINNKIQLHESIQTNWEYRQYLQQNALNIMKYNSSEYCYDLGLPNHTNNNNTPSTNVPHKFKSIYDTNKPGYGYCNSDLKTPYLSREQLNSRLIAPAINVKQHK